MSSVWVLLYADAPNPSGIPEERPAEVSRSPQRSPWAEMTIDQYEDLLSSTQAAYDAWKAAHLAPSAPVGLLTQSPDGTRWRVTVDDAGTVEGLPL